MKNLNNKIVLEVAHELGPIKYYKVVCKKCGQEAILRDCSVERDCENCQECRKKLARENDLFTVVRKHKNKNNE